MPSPLKRIFISAFNCNPNKGSDAGVAWQWVANLALMNHFVMVATRREHQQAIRNWLRCNPHLRSRLKFIYLDYPGASHKLQRIFRGIAHYFYYYYWQIKLRTIAIKLHQTHRFEVIHHVCWVNARLPSFLGGICPKFVFGPVAGGEEAPLRLWQGYGFLQWLQDGARFLWNATVKLDPFLRKTFSQADTIFVTSESTKKLVPKEYHPKTFIQLAIGVEPQRVLKEKNLLPAGPGQEIRILYVGRFLDWKGMGHIGIPAFHHFLASHPSARMTLVGTGRDERRWLKKIRSLNLNDKVNIIRWVERDQLNDIYDAHHLFLFPSLHDSGGMVILEAMARGLPVACLDLGGPKVIVDGRCGVVIKSAKKSVAQVAMDLAQGMAEIIENEEHYRELSQGALKRAQELSWHRLVQHAYTQLDYALPPPENQPETSASLPTNGMTCPPII